MKTDSFYWSIVIASLIALIIILIIVFIPKSQPEITELYFNDIDSLPKAVEVGETYSFEFTIVNLNEENQTYNYDISLKESTLLEDTIKLESNQGETITVEFTIDNDFGDGQILVNLGTQDIYFIVEVQ